MGREGRGVIYRNLCSYVPTRREEKPLTWPLSGSATFLSLRCDVTWKLAIMLMR